jgi:hypothetical protein
MRASDVRYSRLQRGDMHIFWVTDKTVTVTYILGICAAVLANYSN